MKYVLLVAGVVLIIAASHSQNVDTVGLAACFGGGMIGSSFTIELLRRIG